MGGVALSEVVQVKRREFPARLRAPEFFIERFFTIIDKARQEVPFLMNIPQRKFLKEHTLNDLILKARKEGFSSLIEAVWLHACMFNQNIRAVTMSHEMESTKRHFDRVRFYLQHMGFKDAPFKVELDENTQKQITFPKTGSSYWIGTAGAKAFGRGDDITHLHLSEVAHYENQEVLVSALEACVPGAWKIMETTANGVGEAFHTLWKEAGDPSSGSPWKRHFFAWFDDPSNRLPKPQHVTFRPNGTELQMIRRYKLEPEQVLWYRAKRAEMPDKEKMPQEYPSNDLEAFLSSGRHAFNLQKLAEMKERAKTHPAIYTGDLVDDDQHVRLRHDEEGRWKIWKAPRRGASYLISGDVAEGVPDGDYSVMHVLDRSNWEVVARYRGRVDPGTFGREMVKAGYYFNNAVLVPENNNNGWATLEAIKASGYPHLLNTKEIWREGETPKDGFPTNEKTRGLIITALRNAVDDETMPLYDLVTIEEMETFVQNENTGKFEAQEGCHDDCVMSLGIGIYCVKFLTVDETYAERSRNYHGSPVLTASVMKAAERRRGSATGYR